MIGSPPDRHAPASFPLICGYPKAQKRNYCIGVIEKENIAGGKSANSDITDQQCLVREESHQHPVALGDSCKS
jgi:hypothetical protein